MLKFQNTQSVYEKALSMTVEQRAEALLDIKIAATEVNDGPVLPLSKDYFTWIKPILHDNSDLGTYDERSEILTLRYMSDELLHQFRLKDQFVPGIGTYCEAVYELAKKTTYRKRSLGQSWA